MATKDFTFLMVFSFSAFIVMESAANLSVLKESQASVKVPEYSIDKSLKKILEKADEAADEANGTISRKREFRSIFYKNFSPNSFGFLKNSYGLHQDKLKMSKSWGGRGMPFNVLYIPNAQQQKMLKSMSKISEPLIAKSSLPQPKQQQLPEVLDFVLEGPKSSKIKLEEKFYKKPLSRKYYSSIPHFYVSYGW